MPSLRELRRKIKSVKSTQQITKSMKMVAAAKLNRAQTRTLLSRPFSDKMMQLLNELAYLSQHTESTDFSDNPFLKERAGSRVDIVLITADRGLCGGFNTHLIRHALEELRRYQSDDVHLWVVGKKGRNFFRRTPVHIEKEYVNFFQKLGYQQAEILGADIIDCFLKTGTREVRVIYNEFKSRLQQNLVAKRFLPIESVPGIAPAQDFVYEPSRKEILEELFPRHIKAQLYRILLESEAAELAARMTAMESASDNAGEIIDALTLMMNKIRQSTITKEISEIVGGAEALQTA